MSLRLAFDLDGVFADLGAELGDRTQEAEDAQPQALESDASDDVPSRQVTALGGRVQPPFETAHLKGASRRTWKRLSATENFWESLLEIEPGSIQRLAALTRERKWEVIFLTSRPSTEGDSVQIQSQRWLEQHGFLLPSVFVTQGSRGRIAAALSLDLVVDDNPENCLDVMMESEGRAILVWRGRTDVVPASARRLGVGSVSSVDECLSLLDEADREKRNGGGFLVVLKRLLGLRGGVVGER